MELLESGQQTPTICLVGDQCLRIDPADASEVIYQLVRFWKVIAGRNLCCGKACFADPLGQQLRELLMFLGRLPLHEGDAIEQSSF